MIDFQERAQRWFSSFNREFFNDEIRNVEGVSIEDLMDTEVVGYWDPDSGIIGVEQSLPSHRICGILLHEMIHAWQYQRTGKTDHGQEFVKMRNKIEAATGFDMA